MTKTLRTLNSDFFRLASDFSAKLELYKKTIMTSSTTSSSFYLIHVTSRQTFPHFSPVFWHYDGPKLTLPDTTQSGSKPLLKNYTYCKLFGHLQSLCHHLCASRGYNDVEIGSTGKIPRWE